MLVPIKKTINNNIEKINFSFKLIFTVISFISTSVSLKKRLQELFNTPIFATIKENNNTPTTQNSLAFSNSAK